MGPAVESAEKVRELIAAGMNMARLNLSHGSYEEHQGRLDQSSWTYKGQKYGWLDLLTAHTN